MYRVEMGQLRIQNWERKLAEQAGFNDAFYKRGRHNEFTTDHEKQAYEMGWMKGSNNPFGSDEVFNENKC